MPPSHLASRALLVLLLAGVVAAAVVAGADFVPRVTRLALELWAGLRAVG